MNQETLVVKVGTNLLMEELADGSEALNQEAFTRIGKQIVNLVEKNVNVVLVSSAAITAGLHETKTVLDSRKNTEMPELQRLASIGWRHVLNEWDRATPGMHVGEFLLTRADLENQGPQTKELKRVIKALHHHGDLPVINENDTLSHLEIEKGDNDTLGALVAKLCMSDYVILTDVDGLYLDPDNKTTLISQVPDIDSVRCYAGDSGPNGTGGMHTKLDAAQIITGAGQQMWIANGNEDNAIELALAGKIGTHFA